MKSNSQNPKPSSLRTSAKPRGILVLGMHRSGTSALTRVLNLLGCNLPNDLIGPGDGNALGHWESVAAVSLNDTILASAGSSWDDWGPLNPDWRESGLKSDMSVRIQEIVKAHVATGPLFVLKDPRLCRLADLWLDGMDAAGVEPLAVLMLRNPAEVIESLENRDLMAPGYGQLLWLRHVLDAEYFSRGRKRVFCRYDQLMRNWHRLVDRIRSGLAVALPRNSPAVHAEIERFLSGELRHHESGLEAALDDPGLMAWLRRAFAILLDWSERGENPADHAELDLIRDEFDRSYSAFAGLLLDAGIAGNVGSGARLKRELDEQLTLAQGATNAAQARMEELELQQSAAVAREAELVAQAEAGESRAGELEVQLAELRSKAERLAPLETEASRLHEQASTLEAELSALETALEAVRSEANDERDQRLAVEARLATAQAELREEALRNAELTGRSSAAESALVQRQEELAQFWDQLLAAEKAGSAAEAQAAQERERRLDTEQRLLVAEAGLAEFRARLEEASVAPAPAPVPEHLYAEIAQLTRILQEQEAAAQSASDARAAAEQELVRRRAENAELMARLQQQETVSLAAENARAATEQKLIARFEEIARMTAMLADESGRASVSAADADWLRNMMELVEQFPKWWALMPRTWRCQREHARYLRAGLFDARAYLDIYPDVAAHGMDPVRHYILHGMGEGRKRPL